MHPGDPEKPMRCEWDEETKNANARRLFWVTVIGYGLVMTENIAGAIVTHLWKSNSDHNANFMLSCYAALFNTYLFMWHVVTRSRYPLWLGVGVQAVYFYTMAFWLFH